MNDLMAKFRVGKRWAMMTVDVTADGLAQISCTWTPDAPEELSPEEWGQYCAGRDAAVVELAKLLGSPSVRVVEVV